MTLKPTFAKLYPTGSHGEQCTTFAHKLVEFRPIGDSLKEKTAWVNKIGIPVAKLNGDFRVGDVLITRESAKYGHAVVINEIIGSTLQLTESNYSLNEKVNHTRRLTKNSSAIIGVIRGPLKVKVFMNQAKIVKSKSTAQIWICYPVPSEKHLQERMSLEGIELPNPIPSSDSL